MHGFNFSHRSTRCLGAITLLCVLGSWTAAVHASEWPTRPVRIIVPYGAGGIATTLARLTIDPLNKTFGQPFVLENRPGGGGVLGVETVSRAANDGYTLLEAGGSQFSVVPLMQKLHYDPVEDLAPITIIARNGMALAVNKDLPIHSVRELIDYAKAHPGALNYATAGVGTSSHLVPAAFAARTGIELVAVHYQNTPQSVFDVISGSVQIFFGNVSDIVAAAGSGSVRLLAMSTAKRIPQFPDVPTVAETVPGFVMTAWNGYFAPRGTEQSIIDRMAAAVAEICRDPEIVFKLNKLSLEPVCNKPAEVAETIRQELPIYAAAAQAAGLVRR
jgi:tripartite-type tricarboxylate transporter receptor subunit TctC